MNFSVGIILRWSTLQLEIKSDNLRGKASQGLRRLEKEFRNNGYNNFILLDTKSVNMKNKEMVWEFKMSNVPKFGDYWKGITKDLDRHECNSNTF